MRCLRRRLKKEWGEFGRGRVLDGKINKMIFTKILLFIIAVWISIIAVKVKLIFDINKYLERREEKLRQRAKNVCPHAKFVKLSNGKIAIQSTFISPSWTLSWICQQCWLILHDLWNEKKRIEYYIKNPKKLIKQEKELKKILKKIWIV